MKNAAPNSIAGASTLSGLSKGSGSGTSSILTLYEMRWEKPRIYEINFKAFEGVYIMIKLEPLKENEFIEIVKWFRNKPYEFMIQWAGPTYTYPLTEEKMKAHYSLGINNDIAGVFLYKIILTETEEIIGSIQLCKVDAVRKSGVIGRFIIGEERYRGKGYGKQALKELITIAFEEFGLVELKLKVYDFNKTAIKCYESIGFRKRDYIENAYMAVSGSWGEYDMVLKQ